MIWLVLHLRSPAIDSIFPSSNTIIVLLVRRAHELCEFVGVASKIQDALSENLTEDAYKIC